MKKYECPICGKTTNVEEHITKCNSCNTPMNLNILNDETGINAIKNNLSINALNREFKNILNKVEVLNNDLYIEYYKMYASKCLNKAYNDEDFFNHKIDISKEEENKIVLHMLEHIDVYNIDIVEKFIYSLEDNKYYLDVLKIIKEKENEKIIEKEIRETLFPKTIIPYTKKYDNKQTEGKAFIMLGVLLYVLFALIVLIFTEKEIKYQMFNLAFIIPSLILVSGIKKTVTNKKNIMIYILMFIVIYYLTTLLITIPYQNHEVNIFIGHLKGIINTPIDLLMILGERMSS